MRHAYIEACIEVQAASRHGLEYSWVADAWDPPPKSYVYGRSYTLYTI